MKNPQVYQQVDADTYSLTIIQRNGKQHIVLIDADMVDAVSRHVWNLVTHGYLQTKVDGRTVSMHRYIMDAKERTDEIDHINHDVLDNRKSNLRLCIRFENMQNRAAFKNNSLGIKGVCMVKNNKNNLCARATVYLHDKAKVKQFSVAKLGLMPAVRNAAIAARALREQLHGEYACHA